MIPCFRSLLTFGTSQRNKGSTTTKQQQQESHATICPDLLPQDGSISAARDFHNSEREQKPVVIMNQLLQYVGYAADEAAAADGDAAVRFTDFPFFFIHPIVH